jgi:hypothetical protein
MSYTPGPWPYRWRKGFIRIVGSDGEDIARIHPSLREEVNARLISAAPDLLAALQEAINVIEYIKPEGNGNGTIIRGRAAIAKAIGEQA